MNLKAINIDEIDWPILEKYYQPVPFEEYEQSNKMLVSRSDCGERFRKIKESYGDFKGRSLIDIGCANGYFMFRFLQEGGDYAVGVDNDKDLTDFINKIKYLKELKVVAGDALIEGHYDIGLYLDLHYHAPESDKYLEFLANNTGVTFASTSGSGNANNQRFQDELSKRFNRVEEIHSGYADRKIYRCSG